MWTVIYITQSGEAIEKLRAAFDENQIIIKVREVRQNEEDSSVYEILVPDSEISQAHEILLNMQL